ncbi:LysR substrate-binding domain-containing protein [Achromobacter aloeverae]|uniref:LysR family transcriptional regulator n=1 Tax=Achromobacter aloeverae TaxID=1750518 RepID=A0A4V1MS56_9BURK|nr:LysR substrate-binding domain-containing protein [Achromobacter aloeverae]RXN90142.1 LysR family transcriptional regulator [Achromobacter aloeverae]
MPDLDLLRSFTSVVDAGGFTRAGERVHRTQSTVSQQIRKLEDRLGCVLFTREGRQIRLTAEGERLLGYARRMLALSAEMQDAVGGGAPAQVVRLGLPDDFAVESLTRALAAFARTRPDVRLSVRCDLSANLGQALQQGDLDVVLLKREPDSGPCMAAWRERLLWVTGAAAPEPCLAPLSLVSRPQGCLYRNRAIHALERDGRRWRIAYESQNLMGIRAALAGGLGVALVDALTLSPDMRILDAGLPEIAECEMALILEPSAGDAARELAELMRGLCDADRRGQPRGAGSDYAAATTGMGKELAA